MNAQENFISSEWIDWCADEHPELTASDLEWTFEPNFPISRIGGQVFVDEMSGYLDEEIRDMLGDLGFSKDASITEVASNGEGRVAGWMQLDQELSSGKAIEEPVQIAMVSAPDTEHPRNSICDGWHRVGAAIKHGHKTIPAYVGRLKS